MNLYGVSEFETDQNGEVIREGEQTEMGGYFREADWITSSYIQETTLYATHGHPRNVNSK